MLALLERGRLAAMTGPPERTTAERIQRQAIVREMRRRAMKATELAGAAGERDLSHREAGTPTPEEAEAKAAATPGSWFSSLTYDPILWWGERLGMAERRRKLLASAEGSVLELGAGTGLNLRHYPRELDRLVLAEPDKHMAKRLERRLDRLGRRAEVFRAPAEALPFPDQTFDTVVSTLVLCTIADLEPCLDEVRRVLRPGGSLLFLEHVRSDDPRLARWQDRLHGPWQTFADGCNCNRRTLELLREGGFEICAVDRASWRGLPPIVRPLVSGRARPARSSPGAPSQPPPAASKGVTS